MKKIICLAAIFYLLTSPTIIFPQWNPEVQLTTNSGGVTVNQRAVFARSSYVHVVWTDLRHPESEIYYKRSTNSGATWEAETRFTNQSGASFDPQIVSTLSGVYVVWCDTRDGNQEIYFKSSTDNGANWGPVTRLTNDPAISIYPAITAAGYIFIAWEDGRNGNDKIYFKRSSDGGLTWGSDTQISLGSSSASAPSIYCSGQQVYVAWIDYRYGNIEIVFRRSTNSGANWDPEQRLTNNSANSMFPVINAVNQNVNVFWQDDRPGHNEIYLKQSSDGGVNWSADRRLTNGTFSAVNVSTAATGQDIHFVWEEQVGAGKEIFYKRSTNWGADWSDSTCVTPEGGSGFGYNASVTVSGNIVHTVWRDTRNSNTNMLYYRQNPNNGNPTSVTNINSELPKEFSLSQNYPNPFNPNTHIGFRIADFGFVSLKVYDIMGKETAVLVNENLSAGEYTVNFDGSGLASGMYFYKLTSGEFTDTKKLILNK
jgi:hypothetical protein